MRERLKKCGDSERSVDVEQKLNMPLDAIVVKSDDGVQHTEITKCNQCDSLRELNAEYSNIIGILTAQLAKAYGIEK